MYINIDNMRERGNKGKKEKNNSEVEVHCPKCNLSIMSEYTTSDHPTLYLQEKHIFYIDVEVDKDKIVWMKSVPSPDNSEEMRGLIEDSFSRYVCPYCNYSFGICDEIITDLLKKQKSG